MVRRAAYLERLVSWKDEQVIKVVTGIRRCGKSTLLKQYQDLLREQGVGEEQIISINFEELEYGPLLEYHALYQYVKERLCPGKMTYIFLDEIQKVGGFQKVLDSLDVKENTDLYITSSNAYLLSGDLATLLTGRYVELSMLPLSFLEYTEITGAQGDAAFAEYLKYGGLPYVASMEKTEEKVSTYLEGIYNTVIVKDIEDRQSWKESDPDKRKISDITLLKTIARYLAGVIGSQVSVKSVADYLDIFKRLFITDNQPPFSSGIRSSVRVKQAEKRHFADPSLACALLKATPAGLLGALETLGFLFGALCERDPRIYAESFGAHLYHYQDYKNQEIDAVIELPDGQWCAFEIKLGANQIDAAAENLLEIKKQIEEDPKGKPPAVLCVLCGMANAAYQRPDGVFVVPILSLQP